LHVTVNGTRLWFDVDGPSLVPDGRAMRSRPTLVLVHGGPAGWDHTYFKPYFAAMTAVAQVVYLDLRGHGRSEWGDPGEWSFEVCADDIRSICDALEIEHPVVLGHSMGGFVVMLYGARHPRHAARLILQSTTARSDLERLVEGFRRVAGDVVADVARRAYTLGGTFTAEEWSGCFAAFGPTVPDEDELARRTQNRELGPRGQELLLSLDIVAELARIEVPTLVSVGELDPVTPVEASREIAEALPDGLGRLEILPGAGHFPWLDVPETYWSRLEGFVSDRRP
jgi:pimeloyl-ACP methyl ester carboxylesterase